MHRALKEQKNRVSESVIEQNRQKITVFIAGYPDGVLQLDDRYDQYELETEKTDTLITKPKTVSSHVFTAFPVYEQRDKSLIEPFD